jgi:pyruvate formate lyase activating enzyme
MGKCNICGKISPLISRAIEICGECLRHTNLGKDDLARIHAPARLPYGLPVSAPKTPGAPECTLCANLCRPGPGEKGYCGLRQNRDGSLSGGKAHSARVSFYHDPLPTNCVADWVCPAGTGAGFPKYARSSGPDYGFYNLAVFYEACSFDCLFCQNWQFRRGIERGGKVLSAPSLAAAAGEKTACVCYFGGDPSPQLPHALVASRLMRRANPDRILRICFETNGSFSPAFLPKVARVSLESGGCVKFDLKAFNPNLHRALCGVDNTRTLENFAALASFVPKRPEVPLLAASTLLVPGYIDAEEVHRIGRFIASLDLNIPYSLLAFAPQFKMDDLPRTSKRHADECLAAAEAAGLKRIHLGNAHLLA